MGKVHAQFGANEHQRTEDVGGIAHKGDVVIFQFFASRRMFHHGQHVANHLSRMVVIGQTIDHRHSRVTSQLGDGLVLEGAGHDHIHVA
ncbi:hypothetical protein SDC9_172189 [bioreactor metagenome]|uniref:Uncharacterized protein n=1 Tax=bioreactor metagenome TaxID=1076179 RepID=A0A645GD09_9ZZZZ